MLLVNWSTYQDKYDELPRVGTRLQYFSKRDRVDKLYTSAFVRTNDGQIIYDNAGKPLRNPVAQFMGYLNGKYQWSIYNSVSWKGISVGFQFDGNVGGITSDYMHNKKRRAAAEISKRHRSPGNCP